MARASAVTSLPSARQRTGRILLDSKHQFGPAALDLYTAKSYDHFRPHDFSISLGSIVNPEGQFQVRLFSISSLFRSQSTPRYDTLSTDTPRMTSFITTVNQRTRNQFRPRGGKGNTSYQLRQYAEATLGGGSLRKVVKLPEGEDENEWLAVNMVDFYNQINLLYGAITEFCSPQSCPEMKATDEFEYLWQDNENFKRPTKMPAPAYIEQLMSWVQGNIDNESVLPSRIGVPFPKQFPSLVRQIFKRMYRVYAHIYCHHYPVIRELGLEPHLNTSFKQYVLFIDEHHLASGKDYWGPLGDLVESMLKSD
ncbi:putative maintenance of ploidy protein mob1 [Seiridium cardinale]|uniref:Maintenance of ploidy protein mob1 n=1 Tax=Seiridium cardinale TaxID=138064 RepID=A0ABR2Y8X3_9PEZI